MSQKKGWLIETARTSYWDGRGAGRHTFTSDANEAVLFAREQDAERVRVWLLEDFKDMLRSVEHVFGLE
jgi:hypothetical protein